MRGCLTGFELYGDAKILCQIQIKKLRETKCAHFIFFEATKSIHVVFLDAMTRNNGEASAEYELNFQVLKVPGVHTLTPVLHSSVRQKYLLLRKDDR